ncbi:hypothetical protein ASPCADRAFT_134066 [Aspergillus carbonarius ITEM 5010]|uniref:Zn(2)-C6 fungal-type domain-containing protein n=1 Tax=Aspergillus carbonarius (strain ITEM 5010) TaxID=602072 RepID=A0A1R3RAK0_ASPC5|nr:hypothetical protein ASPCADRAFT_134066 [Aspergillus carbonarius ITEM 5010]
MPDIHPQRPKSRPTASCLPCRTRKVKCNRLTPCEACVARNISHECKYAVPDEDRQAIAQAETIADLRAKVNRLRSQLVQGQQRGRVQALNLEVEVVEDQREEDGLADLEAVYGVLRGGSWESAQQVVTRIRAGESVGQIARGVY